jgi:hypothetical protein
VQEAAQGILSQNRIDQVTHYELKKRRMLEISEQVQTALSSRMTEVGLEILFCQSKIVSWGAEE